MADQSTSTLPESATKVVEQAAPVLDLDTMLANASTAYEASVRADAPEAEPQPESEPEAPTGDPAPTPAEQSAPEGVQEPSDSTEDDGKPVSRREAGRLARQAADDALATRARADVAEAELARRVAEDKRDTDEILQALGSNEQLAAMQKQYETLADKGLREGDIQASDEALKLKAQIDRVNDTRSLYGKARRMSDLEAMGAMGAHFEQAKSLPGADSAFMSTVGNLYDAFKHVSDGAIRVTEARLKGQLERQKAEYEGKLAKAAGRGIASPDGGGRETGGVPVKSNLYGSDGLPTAEAQRAFDEGRLKFTR